MVGEGPAPTKRVPVERVATVDDGVAALEQRHKACDRGIHRRAGGHHYPNCPWSLELFDQMLEGFRRPDPPFGGLRHGIGV